MAPASRILDSLPEPLRGSEAGTFAQYTITTRLGEIARRVVLENSLSRVSLRGMEALIDNLPLGRIRFLEDTGSPDAVEWAGYITPYHGWNWLEITWFFAETYFYRRILEATGFYLQGEGWGKDPYTYQKEEGMLAFREAIIGSCLWEEGLLSHPKERDCASLRELFKMNLWGNQADLSMWPAAHEERPENQQSHFLCDQSEAAATYLCSKRQVRIDFFLDNAGLELVNDLLLADFLLTRDIAAEIHLHAKPHPTFVSDVTRYDVIATIDYLRKQVNPVVNGLVCRLDQHCNEQRLKVVTGYYWTSPLAGWEMPVEMVGDLKHSHLLISKGDANYRRLAGDRRWPMNTAPENVFGYLPAPLLVLRVSKSEVAVGLRSGQPEALFRQDPRWQTNGQWGMVQFVHI